MKFSPFVIFAGATVFAWVAIAEQSSSRNKADSEDATPSPSKKRVTPRPKSSASDDDEQPKPKAGSSPVTKKFTVDEDDAKPKAKSTPGRRKSSDDEEDAKPKAGSTPGRKKAADDDEDGKPKPAATPHAKPVKTEIDEKSDTVKKKEAEATPLPGATPGGKGAPPASIESSELAKFKDQPEKVQQLIESALVLSRQGLTYKYGSDDPSNGGMDCSGSVAYLLRAQGFKDVPRDAAGQYVWARKNGQFFAVVSKKAGGFEFSDLQPGDLMFWSGTYSIDRDPPVTHSMVYLGEHKSRKQPVMWGASDGRSYDGKSRYGVGVFDFKMPKAGGEGEGTTAVGNHPDFLGYARIPGLRDAADEKGIATAKEQESVKEKETPKSKDNEEDDAPKRKPKPTATPSRKSSTTRRD